MTWTIHKWKNKDTESEELKTKINFKNNYKAWLNNKPESILMPKKKRKKSLNKKFYKP